MQIFVDHIGYVLATLLAGMMIGWKTYPAYQRLVARLRGEDAAAERDTVRRDNRR